MLALFRALTLSRQSRLSLAPVPLCNAAVQLLTPETRARLSASTQADLESGLPTCAKCDVANKTSSIIKLDGRTYPAAYGTLAVKERL